MLKRTLFAVLTSAILLCSVPFSVSAIEGETAETAVSASSAVTTQAASTKHTETSTTAENAENSTESTTIDYFADAHYDTEGNATLIKREIYNSDDIQFIAITTKDGHVFYVLIDYTHGSENNVYFLNKVDSLDLYSLLYMTDEEKESGINPENAKRAENAVLSAKDETSIKGEVGNEQTTTEDNSDETKEHEVDEPHTSSAMNTNNMILLAVVGVAVLGGLGFVIFKMTKGSSKKKANAVSDDFDDDFDDLTMENEE